MQSDQNTIRHNWTIEEATTLFELPFNDLIAKSHTIHREHFDPNSVQVSTLLNIKTGACPEDCKYCSQSSKYNTELEREKLMDPELVVAAARKAKAAGATRFCMGAAWRSPPRDKEFQKTVDMLKDVRDLGMETCMTLGMLSTDQAKRLKEAGLDYYNHNLDTSPEYYGEITTTRCYQDRLDTLEKVRKANIKVCCGGILGMGEARSDRASLLCQLANLPEHPDSVPINKLVPIKGTPMGEQPEIENFEFIRTIACARIMMPKAMVRLSAGRISMADEMQALCFFAGANSIFYGDSLLTTKNNDQNEDMALFDRLGIQPMELPADAYANQSTDACAS